MKKVLIFTYYWPPAGGIAVQRFLKFSKYLPQFGWEPIIVTVKNGSYPYYDHSLEKEISPTLKVHKTDTFEPFELYNLLRGKRGKILPVASADSEKKKSILQKLGEYIRANYFIPDARIGWINFALKEADIIFRQEKIDAMITTGPPHSTHLIGLHLKETRNVNWLADFRDPWTSIFYNRGLPRSAKSKEKDTKFETQVLRSADAVTVIGPGIKKEFEGRASKIDIVYNGYDDNKFKSHSPLAENEFFTIRYIGSLLASENTEALWKALLNLINSGAKIKIEIIGRADTPVKESLFQSGLGDLVSFHDFIPHQQAVNKMREADMLLYIVPRVANMNLIITGKVFEYLASKSEILAIGPIESDGSLVLKQANRDPMIDYEDYTQMKARLVTAYESWKKNKRAKKHSGNEHNRFAVSQLSRQLAEILNRISL